MSDDVVAGRAALTQDLEVAGIEVPAADLWLLDLSDAKARKRAYPILVDHLERGDLPVKTVAAVATHLSRAAARPYWSRMLAAFRTRPRDWASSTLAAALAASAGKEELPALEQLFRENQSDQISVMFVRALLRLDPTKWTNFFEADPTNEVWGVEARAALKGRGLNN